MVEAHNINYLSMIKIVTYNIKIETADTGRDLGDTLQLLLVPCHFSSFISSGIKGCR